MPRGFVAFYFHSHETAVAYFFHRNVIQKNHDKGFGGLPVLFRNAYAKTCNPGPGVVGSRKQNKLPPVICLTESFKRVWLAIQKGVNEPNHGNGADS